LPTVTSLCSIVRETPQSDEDKGLACEGGIGVAERG
jgi:hypothetical protein